MVVVWIVSRLRLPDGGGDGVRFWIDLLAMDIIVRATMRATKQSSSGDRIGDGVASPCNIAPLHAGTLSPNCTGFGRRLSGYTRMPYINKLLNADRCFRLKMGFQ
jgi:hypothetical protein